MRRETEPRTAATTIVRDSSDPSAARAPRRIGLRHLGVAAVAFFLLKGLLWLAIPGFVLLWRWLR
jgi:hypothetical protein